MMDLLNHSCPSWDMKEVSYNHRSMPEGDCVSGARHVSMTHTVVDSNLLAFVGL